VLGLTGFGASACGGSGSTSSSPSTGPSSPHGQAHHSHPHRLAGPAVGTSQSVKTGGTVLVVRITHVLDPLRDGGAVVPPGMVPVGVLASVKDSGPAGYDGSATSNFSLHSGAGPASPVFVKTGPCQTDVQDFMNAIGAGEVRSGCVAYAVPSGQRTLSVRFSPNQGPAGLTRTWIVRVR
jgi:hypothetical protein